MDREILFRGKRVDNGELIYGHLVVADGQINAGKHYILSTAADFSFGDNGNRVRIGCFVEVDPKTVGQYTGLRDKNGVKIFEGDIVEHDFGNYHIGNRVAVVEYSQKYCGFQLCPKDNWAYCEMDDCVVIGNVHDNPELLED